MMGVNINDKRLPFTEMILAGEKTVETRRSRSLDSVIGQRVGLVKTGCGTATLVAYATIGEPVCYQGRRAFRRGYQQHRVPAGSEFDCEAGGVKWGYPLKDIERVTPKVVTSRGIVLRRLTQ